MAPPDPEEPPAPEQPTAGGTEADADDVTGARATEVEDGAGDTEADPDDVDAADTDDVDDADPDVRDATGPTEGSGGRREVALPPSLYKVVTVFSTLLSVLFVVLGFVVLDRATGIVSNPTGSLVVQALALVGVPMEALVASRSAVALVVGLVGLALVGGGAAVYVYGSRFRAPGMGKPKDEADEGSGDG